MKNKKFLILTSLFTIFAVGLLSVAFYSRSLHIEDSYSKASNSALVSYISSSESWGIKAKDITADWATYEIEGISFKYPADIMQPEEPVGNSVSFKNLVTKDFKYAMTIYVYNTMAYSSSMNFLENFVVTERGTIPHDIFDVQKLNSIEIAQIGNYFNVDGDGFYDLMTALKLEEKGIVLDTAFISEEDYKNSLDIKNEKNDFYYKLILTTIRSDAKPLKKSYLLDKPSQESILDYKKANPTKITTL